jgi:hypothetical protein
MLQITSGKLYPNGVGRKNQLRGVLYSNLIIAGLEDAPIVTDAGSLLQAETIGTPTSIIYELTEQMESDEIAPGILISHGVQPYMHDFAAVVSFALRITCSPDIDLCSRLLSGKRSLAVSSAPSKLVKRVFDQQIWCQQQDRDFLISFVRDLIGLQRRSFLAAMKAIRTYVTGLHRIADDLELAYTLLVASIESLSQDFDGHEGSWNDYESSKRKRIDDALKDADATTAHRVRAALVKIEHLALSRRFRDFALDHISPAYFRETGLVGVTGRLDMRDALKEAYSLRSRYVHNLRRLPDLLSTDMSYSEVVRADHATFLTLEGLARVTRHIILQFVARQPKIATEQYDYRLERYGIIQAPLSPEYWIGRPEGLTPNSGRMWLESFLQQFSGHLQSNSTMTELGAVLVRVEEMLPELDKRQRTPFLALYCLYNRVVPAENRAANFEAIVRQYHEDLAAPSMEALATHLILEVNSGWTIEQHRAEHDHYFEQRNQRSGFRAPGLFEAGFTLALAERYRIAGQIKDARALVSFAAENLPGFPALQTLEATFDPDQPIDWGKVLLPNRSETPKHLNE